MTEPLQQEPLPMSEREYLALERASIDVRHEYVDGHVYAMAGGTGRHADIISNIASALLPAARRAGCRVRTSDMRLRLPSGKRYYPDIMLLCSASDLAAGDSDEVTSPRLIVEITSTTTARIDRTEKLAAYPTIETLSVYLIVAQREHRVDYYQRQRADNTSELRHVASYTHGQVPLVAAGLDVMLAVDDIYA